MQTQDFYTKQPMQTEPMDQNNAPKQPKKTAMRTILAVAGIAVFIIVASLGVLIAQRQVTQQGQDVTPVAPNAPVSQPDASTWEPNNCSVVFTVDQPTGAASCTSKIALNAFSSEGGKPFPTTHLFNANDTFVFKITLAQSATGIGNTVKMTDVLPDGVVFVSDPKNTQGVSASGQTVTYTAAKLNPGEQKIVEFKVRVSEGALVGKKTNVAKVTTSGANENSCNYPFTTVEGIVKCLRKELHYVGAPPVIGTKSDENRTSTVVPPNAALERGREYEYRVSIQVTNRSISDVKVYDLIPSAFSYVRPAPGSEKFISGQVGDPIVTANLGVLQNQTLAIGFIVKLNENVAVGKVTNTAQVYAMGRSLAKEPPPWASICSITHQVLPNGVAECVEKEAFTNFYADFNNQKIPANSEVKPGQEFVYRITLLAKTATSGKVTIVDKLPAELIFIQDPQNTKGIVYTASTRTVSIDLGNMAANTNQVVEFRVQVVANPTTKSFKNLATISTGGSTTTHSCEIPLKIYQEVKTYSCNATCTQTQGQCDTISGGKHVCYDTGTEKVCRLEDNEVSTSCQPAATPTPTPTPPGATPTPTPTATPTPPPAVGCNDYCNYNSDCASSNHICVSTADGNRCRLENNTGSVDCRPATTPTPTATPAPTATPVTYVPTPTPSLGCNEVCVSNADCASSNHICVSTDDGTNRCRLEEYTDSTSCSRPVAQAETPTAQPELPQELPQSGPAEWLTWFKAGLVTLGVGAALFLLL